MERRIEKYFGHELTHRNETVCDGEGGFGGLTVGGWQLAVGGWRLTNQSILN